jgi:DNA processing protein
MTPLVDACDSCLRRTHLVGALAGRIERAGRARAAAGGLLALPDEELVVALRARADRDLHAARESFEPEAARDRCRQADLAAVCCHADGYPARLLDLGDPPAMIHVAGEAAVLDALCGEPGDPVPAVAVVGARRATSYALDVAKLLGRGLAASGMTVVSGMALGVDSASHAGALEAGGPTVAVLAGGADHVYPRSKDRLYREILEAGCAISEMPPGAPVMRWAFPARNRIIAALAAAVVVVEAEERSGSLITADIAADLGRPVGAVPGSVVGTRSAGSNALLHDGAAVVRDARDALDLAAQPQPRPPGRPVRRAPRPAPLPAPPSEPRVARALDPGLRRALDAVDGGAHTPDLLARALGGDVAAATVALTRLELAGFLRRERDGTYARRAGT